MTSLPPSIVCLRMTAKKNLLEVAYIGIISTKHAEDSRVEASRLLDGANQNQVYEVQKPRTSIDWPPLIIKHHRSCLYQQGTAA